MQTQSSLNDTPSHRAAEAQRLITQFCKKGPAAAKKGPAAAKKGPAAKKKGPAAKKKGPAAKKSMKATKKTTRRAGAASSSTSADRDDEVHEAERILEARGSGARLQYLVQWRGFSAEENTWEPARNILDEDLIKSFQKDNKKPSGKRRR